MNPLLVAKVTMAVTLGSFLAATIAQGSGVSYSYLELTGNFDWYTGSNYGDHKINVHEILLHDSSGALSASLETMGNRLSAQAKAENEERRKIREGESLGGPKTLTYSWQKAAAVEGDTKIYGIRLGSSDNPFSMDPVTHNTSEDGLITYGEISMVAGIDNSNLIESENVLLTSAWYLGFRWGGINSNDFSRKENKEKAISAGYFYIPLTYRLKVFTPISVELWGEAGGDVVTAIRHLGSKSDTKIPLDSIVTAGAGYRLENQINFGIKYEQYKGSLVSGWGKKYEYVNPKYQHSMLGGYLAYGF